MEKIFVHICAYHQMAQDISVSTKISWLANRLTSICSVLIIFQKSLILTSTFSSNIKTTELHNLNNFGAASVLGSNCNFDFIQQVLQFLKKIITCYQCHMHLFYLLSMPFVTCNIVIGGLLNASICGRTYLLHLLAK